MGLGLYALLSCLYTVILSQTLSDVPWDSSNVVIAYFNDDDSRCRSSNGIKLDVRSSTVCDEDTYTQYRCEENGTITYIEYTDDDCTEILDRENFDPNDMGCMPFLNSSDIYYRYYCYNDLPRSLNPYRTDGNRKFPYVQEIYNDRDDSDNCTGDVVSWNLYKPDTCISEIDGDTILWEDNGENSWNISTFMYNDTECSSMEDSFTVNVGTCFGIYGFDVTFDASTSGPSRSPTMRPTRNPSVGPTERPTDSPSMRPTGVPTISYVAEFETNFQLVDFPCDEIDDLENDPQVVAVILEAGYVQNVDSDVTVVIKKIEPIGDTCDDDESSGKGKGGDRRLLQNSDTTDLNVTYTTYCGTENTCVELEEETTAEFLEETLVEELEDEFNFDIETFAVIEDSVTTSAVVDADGDTVSTGSKKSNNDDLDGGAVAGIVISVLVFVLIVAGLIYWFYFRNGNDSSGNVGDEIQMHNNTTTTNGETKDKFESSSDDLFGGTNFKPTPKEPDTNETTNGTNTNDGEQTLINNDTQNVALIEEDEEEEVIEKPTMFEDESENSE